MKKLLHHPVVLLFALFVMGFTLADMLTPAQARSEFENRSLAQKPTFSWSSFVDSSFGNSYVSYVNDQFVGRNAWISIKSLSEEGLGKIENNGVVYGKDHYLFEKLRLVPQRQEGSDTSVVEVSKLERSVKLVRQFLEQYPQLPVTVAIAPNSYAVLEEKVPAGFPGPDQEEWIGRIYGELAVENASFVDFYPTLRQHREEYLYYRTDHHWTTLGAYYAYTSYCDAKGLTPVALEELTPNQQPDFYGTFYSKAKLPGAVPDTITWYDVPVKDFAFHVNQQDTATVSQGRLEQENGLPMLHVDTLYDQRKFDTRDKYAAFLWGNSGLVKIQSATNRDHREGETSRLLVIKDSYANSMIPYLLYHYDEIYLVDLRYTPVKLSEFLEQHRFDDLLLLYNFSTFISAPDLAKLRF